MEFEIGMKVQAFGESLHAGHKGTVAADYERYILVKADNESYSKAFKSKGREGKYFQVNRKTLREIVEA